MVRKAIKKNGIEVQKGRLLARRCAAEQMEEAGTMEQRASARIGEREEFIF